MMGRAFFVRKLKTVDECCGGQTSIINSRENQKDAENKKLTVRKGRGGKTCICRDGCGKPSKILQGSVDD